MYKVGDIFKGDFGIKQKFGADPAYYGQFGLAGHEGVDFLTPSGTPETSPFAGLVLRAGYYPDYSNYGNIVVVWDPIQKCAVWYAHNSTWAVDAGQKVLKGQVLGTTGSTGNVTGPHLHFGMVETDAYGNRLNTNNGYIGFIDPLGSKVTWELGTPTITPTDEKARVLKAAVDRLKSESDSGYAGSKAQYITDTMAKIKKIYETGTL